MKKVRITTKAYGEHRCLVIKAQVEDISTVIKRARAIAEQGPLEIFLEDSDFDCPEGKVKLRSFSSAGTKAIFFESEDTATAKEFRVRILRTSDPELMIQAMSDHYAVLSKLRKKRTLVIVGNARIFLDEVEGLGSFVEIEVFLSENVTVDQGTTTIGLLMNRLGIRKKDLVGESYIDLFGQGPTK